jgi:hypothetical protein
MATNRESQITFILSEIEQGGERGEVLAKCGEMWQISPRTFDRLWQDAKKRYSEAQQEAQKAIVDTYTVAAVERLKKGILSKDEALALLSRTAKGKDEDDNPLDASYSERNGAIKIMADLLGWNAPKESNVNVTGSVSPDKWLLANNEA